MSGVFAEWQPRYAERGVATFPVADKRPCVRHWQNAGLKGSSQLAMKFADADAFGFRCGQGSRITLVDIDSKDEQVVIEAIKLFGESPIIWRTGSGNHAMPSATMERSAVFARCRVCPSTCWVAAMPLLPRAWVL